MLLLSGSAWGFGWFGLCGAFMVVCMVVMMLMMGHGSHRSHGSRWFPWGGGSESPGYEPRRPEQTLADRLARGEIDLDEYERRLKALGATSGRGIDQRTWRRRAS